MSDKNMSLLAQIQVVAANRLARSITGEQPLFENTRKVAKKAKDAVADKGSQVGAAGSAYAEQGVVNVMAGMNEDQIVALITRAKIRAAKKANKA